MKVILGKRITTLLFAIVMMLVTFVVDAAELKIVYPENGLYSLQPMCAPSKELTVHNASTTNGANVIIWDINSNWHTQPSHQKWYVLRIGNTEWYKILAENSGSALNIHNGIAANGTNVSIWPFGGNMHEFRFLNAGNGYYVLQGHVNGAYVLDVSGASNTNGANVQIYQFNNSGAQKWKLVPRYKKWNGYAKKTLKAYKDYQLRSQYATYERVDKGDLLIVLNEKGNAYFVQYKTSNGSTKERWVSKDVFKENVVQPYTSNNDLKYQDINIKNSSETTVDVFNGVSSLYPYSKPSNSDTKYCCAALIKRYYKKMYGVEPWNLLPYEMPKASGHTFNLVTAPKVGDIVGINNNNHWAIVKAIDGNNIVLFEQNWRNANSKTAPKNRRVSIGSVNLYRMN